ncbi:sensor histidine kinase [Telluria beijingensis]|uniref:sensor histidine kinase n=1 Tax=Telluria beijingensis TaxID=3068633 RepID=UPI0027961EC7|nr:ATP-binding protein [Massilia sp. REN29]
MTETLHAPAPLPANEARRLQVLIDLDLLDSPPDERFDRITRLAARLFDVPTALVSLVDADRQWFKSRVGMALDQTPRSASFCAHAILQDDVMVVADACQDPRFAHSPLVQGSDGIRFYAGSPIEAGDGQRIGTLCIIDKVPREFGADERTLLRDLAGIVANEVAALELKAAAERERRAAQALKALLEHLPDGVLLFDHDGKVASCNPAAERMFGAPCQALAGRPAEALLGMRPAPVTRHEGNARRADGGSFAAEVSIAEMTLDGQVQLVATVRDVAWHRVEQERVRAANQRRHDYFRTASHELRTPMASILGFSELLLKREFDAATGRELIDIIHRQATRLIGLVNQMLDLARIDSGGSAQMHPAPLDLAELAARVRDAIDDPAQAGRIVLKPAVGPAPVLADPLRAQQALANIVANALAYSAPGSPVTLDIAAAERGGRPGAAVTVGDRGVGMTPEQRRQVYDAFWRAGALPDVPGNGLGMTIVREIVAVHCGEIEIVSQPGDGTQVTLWLPQDSPAAAEECR